MPFSKLIQDISDTQNNMNDIILYTVQKHEKKVIELNEIQLDGGFDSEAKQITPRYTPFTVRIKKKKRQAFDRVTLKDTGDFIDSIKVQYNNDGFEIQATDEKTAALKKKYGKDILGLDGSGKDLLAQEIRPDLITEIKKLIT